MSLVLLRTRLLPDRFLPVKRDLSLDGGLFGGQAEGPRDKSVCVNEPICRRLLTIHPKINVLPQKTLQV